MGSFAGWLRKGKVEYVRVEVSTPGAGKIEVIGMGYGGGLFGRVGPELTDGLDTYVKILNVSSQTAVVGSGTSSDQIGGLIGWMGPDTTLTDSYVRGSIRGNNNVGGLVGENNGTVEAGSMRGIVTGIDNVGGVVGHNSGEVFSSNSVEAVSGTKNVGGVVGYNNNIVSSGYATGDVSGVSSIGGLVGRNGDIDKDADIDSMISLSYATGYVSGSGDAIGGLVGYNGGTVKGHASGFTEGDHTVGGLVGYNSYVTEGYATGTVTGNHTVGGLVGNNKDTVYGYATGSVVGDNMLGGLVGDNAYFVVGYATGNVTGTNDIGGLVGTNRYNAQGYAKGDVKGVSNVGGLVGNNKNTVYGYARGNIRRSSGTSLTFGAVIGLDEKRSDKIFSSRSTLRTESRIYDGSEGTTELTGTTGSRGATINIARATQTVFIDFVFGTAAGQWTWVGNSRWPAKNIGDDIKPAIDQPVYQ